MNIITATAELNAFTECPVGAMTARSLEEKAGKQASSVYYVQLSI